MDDVVKKSDVVDLKHDIKILRTEMVCEFKRSDSDRKILFYNLVLTICGFIFVFANITGWLIALKNRT